MQEVPKLRCKIFKVIYNTMIFLGVVCVLGNLNLIPGVSMLTEMNSHTFLDVIINSISTVFVTTMVILAFIKLYINAYKFITYKPKPQSRALISDGSLTKKKCSVFNIFC